MSTATTAAAVTPQQPLSLWESLPIQVICGTGEFGVGKTLFGLTIDPGPRTLVYDNEGSSTVYQSLGFAHIDMAAEIRRWLRETKQEREPRPVDRWVWWREHSIASGKSGRFSVCMVDPFSEIEAGLADYVMDHPAEFGKTKAQFLNASGLFWGCVKDALKEHLDNLRTLYQTVYLVTHMRERFSGGRPTGKREPKGKETLFELATLYLKFEREVDAKGNVPAVPAATVLKSRLSHTKIKEDGEVLIIPILPPRLPKATPASVRQYIKTPPDYDKLGKDERVREEKLTEDERLMLQAQEAESRRAAAEAELVLQQERTKEATARATAATPKPAHDQSAKAATEKAEASAANGSNATISPAFLKRIVDMARSADLLPYMKEAAAAMGVTNPAAMTREQGEELLSAIKGRINDSKIAEAKERLDATSAISPEESAAIIELAKRAKIVPAVLGELLKSAGAAKVSELTAEHAAAVKAELQRRIDGGNGSPGNGKSSEPGSVTPEQLGRIKKLVESVGEQGFPRPQQEEYLRQRGVKTFRSISAADAEGLIENLMQVELGFQRVVGG